MLALAATLLFAGCKSLNYTSTGAYLGAIHTVETEMKPLGLLPVGSGRETVNEPYVFDDEWKNDWVVYDTRRFADSLGNTASFTVRYRECKDGVINVEVSGCDVSHPSHYEGVCGADGAVQRLNRLDAAPRSSRGNSVAGVAVLGGCFLAVPILALLLAI